MKVETRHALSLLRGTFGSNQKLSSFIGKRQITLSLCQPAGMPEL